MTSILLLNFKLFSILAACQNSRWIVLCWSSSNKSKLSQHGCDHGSLTHNRSTSGRQWTSEPLTTKILTFYTLASLYNFSLLFLIHFLWHCKENLFNNQELHDFVFISFFSPDLDVWFRCDIVRRSSMLINLRGKRVTCNPSF